MLEFLQSPSVIAGAHALAALLALGGAWAIASLMRLNKGAAANRAWFLMSLGLIFIAGAEAARLFQFLDLPNLSAWAPFLTALGLLLELMATLEWRRLLAKLIK